MQDETQAQQEAPPSKVAQEQAQELEAKVEEKAEPEADSFDIEPHEPTAEEDLEQKLYHTQAMLEMVAEKVVDVAHAGNPEDLVKAIAELKTAVDEVNGVKAEIKTLMEQKPLTSAASN